jgi:hypothetical protein
MCCQRECKETKKKKRQASCGKLACQVYLARNVDFACKTPNQALWKHV